jgi:2-aminoadipate transaminase
MEKIALGKQATDLCTSTLAQYFALEYFGEDNWREYVDSLRGIYRSRRDAMLEALDRHFPEQATWTRPGGGLFVWATLPAYIDTSDLLAKALRENVAFVPGAAAYLERGRGTSSMRLNFSGSTEDEIREGIRRIGKVVREQLELYETITGEHVAAPAGQRSPGDRQQPPERGADVLPLRRRREGG